MAKRTKRARAAAAPAGETCYGCGTVAPEQPMVGVMHRQDVAAGAQVIDLDPSRAWVGVPICDLCHREPTHRTAHALKCHFHPRGVRARTGILLAGSTDLGMGL
jgi:hypothetical protein